MDKVTIIGGGFSAFIAQLLLGDRVSTQIISPSNLDAALGSGSTMSFHRRDSLEINKLLGSNAHSFGSLQVQLSRAKLHDRLIPGGNSKIWGGFFDSQQVTPSLLKLLGDAGIHLETLSFSKTGSISNLTWKVKRNGQGTETSYTLIPSSPDAAPFDWTGIEPYPLEKALNKVPYAEQEAFYLGFDTPSSSSSANIDW